MTYVLVTFKIEGPEEPVETQWGQRFERETQLNLTVSVPSGVSDVLAADLLRGLSNMNARAVGEDKVRRAQV